jgi:hypothetical protein
VRSRLAVAPVVVGVGLAYGALLVFLRGSPNLDAGDGGVFVSVAARLLDGDRLYVDVFDNKDPLFYYADAAALAVGGWRAPAALDALWLALGAVSAAGLLHAVAKPRWLAVVGFVAYPLLLTATWYAAGYSMLAALALAPLVGWLAARQQWLAAGVTLGVATLFKSNLFLVLVAAPAALVVLQPGGVRIRSALAKLAAGLLLALGVIGSALAVRGELRGYLSVLRENISYANDVLVYKGGEGGVHGHLRVAVDEAPHPRVLLAVFGIAVLLAIWTFIRSYRGPSAPQPDIVLAGLFVAVSAATLVTIALTAVWDHHIQMLAYPEMLLIAYVAGRACSLLHTRTLAMVGAAVVLGVGLWFLGGTERSTSAGTQLSRWRSKPLHISATALESVAARRLPGSATVSYARLGSNDDEGHAAFLDDRFDLSCPRFHQYGFTPNLDAVLQCIARRQPQLILTMPSFTQNGEPRWSEFVVQGRALLARDYQRAWHVDTHWGPVDVWIHR